MTVVELAAVRDPALVLPTVAHVLGVTQGGGQTTLAVVAAHLGGRPRLLVLDNLEHLLPASPDVARLVDACPGVVVLATSRAPLRLRAERQLPLAPLSLPATSDVASVSGSGAGQMLLERARAVSPSFALTERTAPAIAAICRQLDGLPLAHPAATTAPSPGGPHPDQHRERKDGALRLREAEADRPRGSGRRASGLLAGARR